MDCKQQQIVEQTAAAPELPPATNTLVKRAKKAAALCTQMLVKPLPASSGQPEAADHDLHVPLKEVRVGASLHEALGFVSVEQVFENPGSATEAAPIEVIYKFPKLKGAIISKLTVTVGEERVIEAKVVEKRKAADKYEDALGGGHGAVMLKENADDASVYDLAIGNVRPGQTIAIRLLLLQTLSIKGGVYQFDLPLSYFPDVSGEGHLPVKSSFTFSLTAQSSLLEVCHPTQCKVKSQSANAIQMEMNGPSLQEVVAAAVADKPEQKKFLQIVFKTAAMEQPRLLYQNCKQAEGHVALMASFMPTFQEVPAADQEQQASTKFVQDASDIEEVQMDLKVEQELNCDQPQFFFLLDRSWSMNQHGRMQIALQALELFLMSLPANSAFQIISFGDHYEWLNGESQMLPYNNENLAKYKDQIKHFAPFYEGTNMCSPLEQLFAIKKNGGEVKQKERWSVFLLTDGAVSNRHNVIDLIRDNSDPKLQNNTKVFSFGVGSGADKTLVNESAEAGGGKSYFVQDSDESKLKIQVIRALSQATEACLKDCRMEINLPKKDELAKISPNTMMPMKSEWHLGNLYRNQMVQSFSIVSQEDFLSDDFFLQFSSQFDPRSKQPLTQKYFQKNFVNLDEVLAGSMPDVQAQSQCFSLEQFAAQQVLEDDKSLNMAQADRVNLSVKYQVLSPETSFIGLVKRLTGEQAISEEMQQIDINEQLFTKAAMQKSKNGAAGYNYMASDRMSATSSSCGFYQSNYGAAAPMSRGFGPSLGSAAPMSRGFGLGSAAPSGSAMRSYGAKACAAPPRQQRAALKSEKSARIKQSSYPCNSKQTQSIINKREVLAALKKQKNDESYHEASKEQDISCFYQGPLKKAMRKETSSKPSSSQIQESPSHKSVSKEDKQLATDSAYQSLLSSCSSDGYWSTSALQLLQDYVQPSDTAALNEILAGGCLQSKTASTGSDDSGDQQPSTSVATSAVAIDSNFKHFVLTLLALQILRVHFGQKQEEWAMIKAKAVRWARTYKGGHGSGSGSDGSSSKQAADALEEIEAAVKRIKLVGQ